jgi:hypothetical protein
MAYFFRANDMMINLDTVTRIVFDFGGSTEGKVTVTSATFYFVESGTQYLTITAEWAQELWDRLQEDQR